MSSATVIVTHYNRPSDVLKKAVDSALAQTVECDILVTDKTDNPYLSWYKAIYSAGTEYVAILHDDDWYEPEFIERCLAEMRPDAGFVFTNAMVRWADRDVENFPGIVGGYVDSGSLSNALRTSGGVISPSCVVLRRDDALNTLLPGGVPLAESNGVLSGPDALMTMLLLIKYPCAAFIKDTLVNFSANADSTTLKSDPAKLRENYVYAWRFFDAIRGAGKRVQR